MSFVIDYKNEYFDPETFRKDEFNTWVKTKPDFIKFYGQPAVLKRLQARLSHYKMVYVKYPPSGRAERC